MNKTSGKEERRLSPGQTKYGVICQLQRKKRKEKGSYRYLLEQRIVMTHVTGAKQNRVKEASNG